MTVAVAAFAEVSDRGLELNFAGWLSGHNDETGRQVMFQRGSEFKEV